VEKEISTASAISEDENVILVGWDGQDDPLNPAN